MVGSAIVANPDSNGFTNIIERTSSELKDGITKAYNDKFLTA